MTSPDPDTQNLRDLTFAEREGAAPLPSQLQLREVSQELRAVIWRAFSAHIKPSYPTMGGLPYFDTTWRPIFEDLWSFRDHKVATFENDYHHHMAKVHTIVAKGDYLEFFGLLEWIIRRRGCPAQFRRDVGRALRHARAAYRVVDDDTIMPISDEQEAATVNRALTELAGAEFVGARKHLKASIEQLRAGKWADSIRESVHSLEAAARALTPSARELGPALRKLEESASIHEALKRGFGALYGFASDEKGIRHPLIDDDTANVDETDALFMLGACASFVSYLIGKGRRAGLLNS